MSNTFGDFTFQGWDKVIRVSPGVVQFSAAEVYSRWKQWASSGTKSRFEPAFSGSVGGESLGGGVAVGGYFFLQNGWKIRPQEADHQLLITGNLYPVPDSAAMFQSTLGDFQVVVSMRTSSLTQSIVSSSSSSGGGSTLEGDGSGLGGGLNTSPTADQIAIAVWEKNIAASTAGAGKDVQDIKKTTSATLGLTD